MGVSPELARELMAAGWCPPPFVRALVAAAGGKIEIPESLLEDPPEILEVWRPDIPWGAVVVRTRREPKLVSKLTSGLGWVE